MIKAHRTWRLLLWRFSVRFLMLVALTISLVTAWLAHAWQQWRIEQRFVAELKSVLGDGLDIQNLTTSNIQPGLAMF